MYMPNQFVNFFNTLHKIQIRISTATIPEPKQNDIHVVTPCSLKSVQFKLGEKNEEKGLDMIRLV